MIPTKQNGSLDKIYQHSSSKTLETLHLGFDISTTAYYFKNLGFNILTLCDTQLQYKPSYLL